MVNDEEELGQQIDYLLQNFNHQPSLVEGNLSGRQFSVAVLVTENPKTLSIMEVNNLAEYGTTQTEDIVLDCDNVHLIITGFAACINSCLCSDNGYIYD